MPELRSCYFCGDPGESLGTYAVIPPRLNPTDEEQRTVVLCSTCQQKLVRVMEPLVERATASSAATTGQGDDVRGEPSTSGSPPEPTGTATGNAAEPGIQPSDRGITIPSTDAGDADETGIEDADDGVRVDDGDDGDPLGDVDTGGPAADASTAGPPSTGDRATEREAAAEPEMAVADRDTETGDKRDERDGALPDEYRKVMRLIENREFPMARADLETVVTSAYGLEDDQCRQILDTAIERGVLVEDGAELDRA